MKYTLEYQPSFVLSDKSQRFVPHKDRHTQRHSNGYYSDQINKYCFLRLIRSINRLVSQKVVVLFYIFNSSFSFPFIPTDVGLSVPGLSMVYSVSLVTRDRSLHWNSFVLRVHRGLFKHHDRDSEDIQDVRDFRNSFKYIQYDTEHLSSSVSKTKFTQLYALYISIVHITF